MLAQALKVSLDELRMQMLGVQVLFGFQFQGLFQDGAEGFGSSERIADATGLGMMVICLGLCLAVPCQHRLVEQGAATPRIYQTARHYANRALLPLAIAIACDLYVASARTFGAHVGTVLAIAAGIAACAIWFIPGLVLRRGPRRTEEMMQATRTPLHAKIEQMLTEARVVLPGAQALLGFQLIVMMTKAFDQLPLGLRHVHLVALASLTLTVILLIAPAAIHRVGFGGQDDPRFHRIGSRLLSVALAPLALAIACDLFIAFFKLFPSGAAGLTAAASGLVLLLALWYGFPLVLRQRFAPADKGSRE